VRSSEGAEGCPTFSCSSIKTRSGVDSLRSNVSSVSGEKLIDSVEIPDDPIAGCCTNSRSIGGMIEDSSYELGL
jgi:hypothetical protein